MNDYINIDSTIAGSMDAHSKLTSSYLSLFTLFFRGHGHGDLFAIMKLDAEGFMYSWEGRDRMVVGFTITYPTNAYRY